MTASNSATDAAGGVLTAEDVRAVLIEPLLARAVITSAQPNIVRTNGHPARWPLIDTYNLADPWRGQNELIGESDPTYDELVLLDPLLKGAKVIHRVSRQLIRGASESVLNALGDALITRFGLLFDRAFLVGDGAANTPTGFVNQAGVQTVAAVGTPDIDTLHDTVQLAMAANANPSAWFLNPREWTTFRKAKTADGHYLLQPDPTEAARWTLLGIPAYPTTQLPTDGGVGTDESQIVLADMAQVVVAVDEDVDVTILEERYADYDQIGIRVTARMDFGLTNPEGVVVLDGVTAV